MSRFFWSFICLIVIFSHNITVSAVNVSAQSAIAIDADTEQILYQKNSEQILPMASTTKIMTALIALEQLDVNEIIEIKAEYTGIEGSSMYLKEGEQIAIIDIIYGLMLMSGNDAAVALACEVSGNTREFVKIMNDRAKQMGLENTSFETPNGLDGEQHYTTAHELALITMEAMKNNDFAQIVSTQNHNLTNRYMQNHNKLLWKYEHAIGVKTGYTKKSGRCLVSASEQNGRTIVVVTLNAPDDWNDHIAISEYAFAQYSPIEIDEIYSNDIKIPIISSEKTEISLMELPNNLLYLTEKEKKDIKFEIIGQKFLYAPITKGQLYGIIKFKAFDKDIISYPLILNENAKQITVEQKSIGQKVLDFLYNLI